MASFKETEAKKMKKMNIIKEKETEDKRLEVCRFYNEFYDDECDEDRAAALEASKWREIPGRPGFYRAPATRPIVGVPYHRRVFDAFKIDRAARWATIKSRPIPNKPGWYNAEVKAKEEYGALMMQYMDPAVARRLVMIKYEPSYPSALVVNDNEKDEDNNKQAKDLVTDINNKKVNDDVNNKNRGRTRSENILRATTATTKGLNVCMSTAGTSKKLREEIVNKTPAAVRYVTTDINNDKVNDNVKNKNKFVVATGYLNDEIRNDGNTDDEDVEEMF